MHVCVCSATQLSPTVNNQAPLSMEFSWQKYWKELTFSTSGVLTNRGIESTFLVSPALTGGFFTTTPPGKLLGAISNQLKLLG